MFRYGQLLFVLVLWLTPFWLETEAKCEPMKSTTCSKLGYSMTIVPNYFGHQVQAQAIKGLQEFNRLRLDIRCSQDINFFLCSVFFPMCTILQTLIPPCRSLCLRTRNDCEAVLHKLGYSWPKNLDCMSFPKLGNGQACVFQNRSSSSSLSLNRTSSTLPTTDVITEKIPLKERQKLCWKSKNSANKQCCRHGNKAARMTRECSLKLSKRFSRKKIRFLKRKRAVCLADKTDKRCYQSCCQQKKKQMRHRKKKTRKVKNRRTG